MFAPDSAKRIQWHVEECSVAPLCNWPLVAFGNKQGFMKYMVEMMMHIPSFIKISSGIQKMGGGAGIHSLSLSLSLSHTHTHTHTRTHTDTKHGYSKNLKQGNKATRLVNCGVKCG
jgi:hypothetical protein